jgi:hypothetical protein
MPGANGALGGARRDSNPRPSDPGQVTGVTMSLDVSGNPSMYGPVAVFPCCVGQDLFVLSAPRPKPGAQIVVIARSLPLQ